MALNTSLVAAYNLSSTADAVGSRTLTNTNSVIFNPGLIGNAADFGNPNTNKSLSYVTDNLGWSGGAMAMQCWVKLNTAITSSPNTYGFLEWGDNTTGKSAMIIYYIWNGGTPQIVIDKHQAGVVDSTAMSALTMNTTSWYHFVLSFDGTIGTLYVNGSSVATFSNSGNGSGTEDQGITIGWAPRFAVFAPALIDMAYFWNRALTSTEVTQLYNSGAGLQYPFASSGNSNFLAFF